MYFCGAYLNIFQHTAQEKIIHPHTGDGNCSCRPVLYAREIRSGTKAEYHPFHGR